MSINATSLANGVGVTAQNVQFVPAAENLPRKILILATYDPGLTAVVPLVPVQVFSDADAGAQFGFGFMAHRLAQKVFAGAQGVPTFIMPMAEAGGAAAAAGSIDFTSSANVIGGTISLYAGADPVSVTVATAATASNIATALAAAVTAIKELPVAAVVDGSIPGKVNFTAKSKGTWGNGITLKFNLGAGQSLPSGVVATVVQPTGGTGVAVMASALAALGADDAANEDGYTDLVHGALQDSTSLDALSAYNGAGNTATGLYTNTVGRPFRALTGDVVVGSGGLTAMLALGNGRKLDRTNGVIAVPGSPNHPSEIAALAIGIMAATNQNRVAESYTGKALTGIFPGAKADRWTTNYDNRDSAVRAGVSPTRVRDGAVILQNVVSFYHPDAVTVSSNGYRSMRNISILQNILAATRANFQRDEWQGISIVADVAKVTNTTDRLKTRDVDNVKADLVALARLFEGKGWIYTADYTIAQLKVPGAVTIRSGGTGFENLLGLLLSGEGGIMDTLVQFDTSFAALTR